MLQAFHKSTEIDEYLAVVLFHHQRRQVAPATWSHDAVTRVGEIMRAMRGAHQVILAEIEEIAFVPVQFNRHMRALVHVGKNLALETNREAGRITAQLWQSARRACVRPAPRFRRSCVHYQPLIELSKLIEMGQWRVWQQIFQCMRAIADGETGNLGIASHL